jgi:hypothetical protein
MTPQEFNNLPSIKALLDKGEYAKASGIAYAMGNMKKDNGLRKHAAELAAKI